MLRDDISSMARFWTKRAYGDAMIRTANARRMRHLEQRLANDGHLPELVRGSLSTLLRRTKMPVAYPPSGWSLRSAHATGRHRPEAGTPTSAGRSGAPIGPGPTARPSASLSKEGPASCAGLRRPASLPAPHGAKPCPGDHHPASPPAPTALDRRSAMRARVADARGNHTWLPGAGGVPDGIRSDHGPELMAAATRDRLARAGAETPCVEPGAARQKGYAAELQQQAPRPAARQGDPLHAATGVGAADPTAFRSCLNACPTHIAAGTRSARGPLGFLCSRDACFVRFIAGRTPGRCTPA